MTNKLILKRVAVAALIFGALVFTVEGLLFRQNDLGSFIILYTIILSPVVFLAHLLGCQDLHVQAHPFYMFYILGMNAAIYSILFAMLVYLIISIITNWRKGK
jgi:hypothetical protein